MTLSVQFITMIAMVSGGLYLGIMKDTYYRFTPYWRGNVFLVYFMEICFWLTQTVLLLYVLFRVNGGELRLYIFAAGLLGFSIYQVLVASIYKKLLEQIIRIVTAIYRFIEKLISALIITPIKWMVKLLIALVLIIFKIVSGIFLFFIKILFAPIKWILRMLYKLLPEQIKSFFYKIAGFYSTMKNKCMKILKYIKFKGR